MNAFPCPDKTFLLSFDQVFDRIPLNRNLFKTVKQGKNRTFRNRSSAKIRCNLTRIERIYFLGFMFKFPS